MFLVIKNLQGLESFSVFSTLSAREGFRVRGRRLQRRLPLHAAGQEAQAGRGLQAGAGLHGPGPGGRVAEGGALRILRRLPGGGGRGGGAGGGGGGRGGGEGEGAEEAGRGQGLQRGQVDESIYCGRGVIQRFLLSLQVSGGSIVLEEEQMRRGGGKMYPVCLGQLQEGLIRSYFLASPFEMQSCAFVSIQSV